MIAKLGQKNEKELGRSEDIMFFTERSRRCKALKASTSTANYGTKKSRTSMKERKGEET